MIKNKLFILVAISLASISVSSGQVTTDQNNSYANAVKIAKTSETELAKSIGSYYAGSWIEEDSKGGYQYIVASTGLLPKSSDMQTTYRKAKYSLTQLNNAQKVS